MKNVVGLLGGLGNQLFQYSFGKWLELQSGHPTKFDLSAFRSRPDYLGVAALGLSLGETADWLNRLPYPGGRYPRTARVLRTLAGPSTLWREVDLGGLPTPLQLKTPAWYYGYWQAPSAVAETIGALRSESLPAIMESSAPSTRIAMHVRRGDMVGQQSSLDARYYRVALDRLIRANALPSAEGVTVFSDDPAWCRENLEIRAQYAPAQSAAHDLLSLSRHEFLVLSGSTFSWWAANLQEREAPTVIAPAAFTPGAVPPLDMPGWLTVAR
ncbi:alpha-1,2-fucosyltransferase [Cryobacterium tagatosivorans]|uniref:Alpha-1,2-fucosyltransferase n=1 Tax=Cryobacterium tagatosivorans TaxID=1259199 RepID=A0A4R8UB64_9MICO|nr:hypothetical protein E3O23_14385 [Cryobacterium tagatosivorans]